MHPALENVTFYPVLESQIFSSYPITQNGNLQSLGCKTSAPLDDIEEFSCLVERFIILFSRLLL